MQEDLFTNKQLQRFANIFDNAGQVIFASVIIPPLIGTIDISTSRVLVFTGAVSTIILWWLSLRLERIASNEHSSN